MCRRWIAKNPEFEEAYERARRLHIDAHMDGLTDLADTALGLDAAGVHAVRLAVDTRKWIASKVLPNRYGEKIPPEVTGAGGAPLIPPSRETQLPKLVATLAVLLPGTPNTDLFALAGTLLDKAQP